MSYVLFTVIPTSTLPKAALYNSLKSWSMLHSQPRCIVFGPKTLNLRAIYGIDPAKLGMDYFPVLERDLNVGRLPALFPRVIALSGSSMALYVDPLAILTQAFASSLRGALSGLSRERDFVLVGDGYEMQIEQDLPFYYPDWLVQLLESTKVGGCRNFTVLGFTRTAFVKQDIPDTLLSEARDVLGLLRLFNQQHVPVVHIQASPAAPVVIVQAELGATRTPRLSFQPVTGDAPDPTPAGHLQYNYEVFNATRLAPRHLDHGFLAPSFTLVHAPQVLKLAPQDGSPPASNAAENTPHTDAVVLHVAAQRDAAPGRGAVADNLPGEHDFENTGVLVWRGYWHRSHPPRLESHQQVSWENENRNSRCLASDCRQLRFCVPPLRQSWSKFFFTSHLLLVYVIGSWVGGWASILILPIRRIALAQGLSHQGFSHEDRPSLAGNPEGAHV